MARSGSVTCAGANRASAASSASTSSRMGCFTCSSKIALRGRNHSRRLLRARRRKKSMPSRGKPGNGDRMDASLRIEVMPNTEDAHARLAGIPNLTVSTGVPLSRYTRFGIGGPADLYAETGGVEAFVAALAVARSSGLPTIVVGGGTNLIVSDCGFRGLVLRYRGERLTASGNRVVVEAGAVLQDPVGFAVGRGLQGASGLAGSPGSAGAAIYGNAGAYGHSISERVASVRFHDGSDVRECDNAGCEFQYRESVFKRH